MKEKNYYIIDFDSTFTKVEALDELARISLSHHPQKEEIFKKIEDYTNMAMEGKLSFSESLEQRVKLLEATDEHLKKLIAHLKKKVSRSFSRNENFFKKHADDVLIVSGGFKEFIVPVVKKYHIKKENVYANTFIKKKGKIIGYDRSNPLSEEGGKVKLMQQLNLKGNIYGIGDGYSDFQLRESGHIKKFFAFTENISRKTVVAKADYITPSLDEFLYINKLPGAISYPKNRIVCLAIGNIQAEAATMLQLEGFTLVQANEADKKTLANVSMLFLANGETIDDNFIKTAKRLKVIGCAGNAKNILPLPLCTEKGIAVFDDAREKQQHIAVAGRMAAFIDSGATYRSANLPGMQLPAIKNAHRIIHIHKNIPGVMANINTVYAKNNINIVSQFLMTNEKIGYVITDIFTDYDKRLYTSLKNIKGTIQFRVLY